MGFKQIREYIPVFYHRLLPPFFEEEIPAETFTRCVSCPMTASSREEMDQEVSRPFAPDTRCCTYIPRLPGYFAGAVFSDPEMKTGRELLRKRISGKRGIFPQGIYPDKKYRLLYEFGRKNGFGKSSLLRCPYYVQGDYNCTLWKYRESICATWFCKYLAADAGRDFWYEMRDLFKLIQEKLTGYAIMKLGLPDLPPFGNDEQLSYEDLEELPENEKDYRQRWQHWEGREEVFYIRSFEIIDRLQADEFQHIMGPEYAGLLKILEEKYHRMVDLPPSLQLNPTGGFQEVMPGKYRLRLNSFIDRNETVIAYSFDVPKPVLDCFRDGNKKTNRIMAELAEEFDIELGRDMIIAMFHHGILIAGRSV